MCGFTIDSWSQLIKKLILGTGVGIRTRFFESAETGVDVGTVGIYHHSWSQLRQEMILGSGESGFAMIHGVS